MKTLKEQTIIYDDDCPMCAMYTNAFVKTRMLDDSGRIRYSVARKEKQYKIDWDRARHEIALVNRRDGRVTYGLDSLLQILGNQWPWMIRIFRWKPLYTVMHGLYKFISYNRKVIAPSARFRSPDACTPDYHGPLRWMYIFFASIVTILLLSKYTASLEVFSHGGSLGREWFICGGQLLWQGSIARLANRDRWMDYLGNMVTVSLIGALLLLPGLWVLPLFQAPPIAFTLYFGLVVMFMLMEHIRRVGLIKAWSGLSITWVAYRIIVLLILLLL